MVQCNYSGVRSQEPGARMKRKPAEDFESGYEKMPQKSI